jgi:hypothetical protein
MLTRTEYPELKKNILLESIEVVAYNEPAGVDGPLVFSGQSAIYTGPDRFFDDGQGHVLTRGIPTLVSDSAAQRLRHHPEIVITNPPFLSRGPGCC